MVEQTFSINKAWQINPPCYVRKVDRSGHWLNAGAIQDKVFCPEPDGNTVSVYVVNSAMDLVRVAVALNANRKGGSKTEPMFLVAVTPEELAGIAVRQTNGVTLCKWANHLHRDLLVAYSSQTANLAQTLMSVGRSPFKFTKKHMKEALEVTTKQGCYAASQNSVGCVCEEELPKSESPSWFGWLGRMLASSIALVLRRSGRPIQAVHSSGGDKHYDEE